MSWVLGGGCDPGTIVSSFRTPSTPQRPSSADLNLHDQDLVSASEARLTCGQPNRALWHDSTGTRVLGIWGRLPREVSLSWSSPQREVSVRRGEGSRPRGQQVQGSVARPSRPRSRVTKDKASGQVKQ